MIGFTRCAVEFSSRERFRLDVRSPRLWNYTLYLRLSALICVRMRFGDRCGPGKDNKYRALVGEALGRCEGLPAATASFAVRAGDSPQKTLNLRAMFSWMVVLADDDARTVRSRDENNVAGLEPELDGWLTAGIRGEARSGPAQHPVATSWRIHTRLVREVQFSASRRPA